MRRKRVRKGLRWVCMQLKQAAAAKDKIESSDLKKKLPEVRRKIVKTEECGRKEENKRMKNGLSMNWQ